MNIEHFINFAEQRSPGFSSRIIPASTNSINRLITYAKNPLPDLYLEYLQKMGFDSAEFQIPNTTLNANDILDFYKTTECEYPKDRFTVFGLQLPIIGHITQHHFFDYSRILGGNPAVVRFEPVLTFMEGEEWHTANSFHEYLIGFGFQAFSLNKKRFHHNFRYALCLDAALVDLYTSEDIEKYMGSLPTESNRMVRAQEIAQQLGFQPALPPTRDCWAAEKDGNALMIKRMPNSSSFSIKLGFDDMREVRRVCLIYKDHLDYEDEDIYEIAEMPKEEEE